MGFAAARPHGHETRSRQGAHANLRDGRKPVTHASIANAYLVQTPRARTPRGTGGRALSGRSSAYLRTARLGKIRLYPTTIDCCEWPPTLDALLLRFPHATSRQSPPDTVREAPFSSSFLPSLSPAALIPPRPRAAPMPRITGQAAPLHTLPSQPPHRRPLTFPTLRKTFFCGISNFARSVPASLLFCETKLSSPNSLISTIRNPGTTRSGTRSLAQWLSKPSSCA